MAVEFYGAPSRDFLSRRARSRYKVSVFENFSSAAARHWNESSFLTGAGSEHLQEAAYLAGYAAECALKVLVQLGSVAGKKLGHDLAALSGPGLEMAVLFNPQLRRLHCDVSICVSSGLPAWNESYRYDETDAKSAHEYRDIILKSSTIAAAILTNLALDGTLTEIPV